MRLIELSKRGKHAGKYFAQVDDEDFDFINQWDWSVWKSARGLYAKRYDFKNKITILMHRELCNLKKGDSLFCDHKDGNGLNNQRSNLRLATISQNSANRKPSGVSKYLGVHPDRGKWNATISINRKPTYIGRFNTEDEAASAYNTKAHAVHGEFARLNIINP